MAESNWTDAERRQQRLEEMLPVFEHREQAFAHLARVLALKPGDMAFVPWVENRSLGGGAAAPRVFKRGMYIGRNRDGDPRFAIYDEGEKYMRSCVVAWGQVIVNRDFLPEGAVTE